MAHGTLARGEASVLWVHQGFGLTGQVEGGRVPLAGDVHPETGPVRVVGVWDGRQISTATAAPETADHDAPPVVLRAPEGLRGPQDLSDTEREAVMGELFSRAEDRLLGFGGTAHNTFACLLHVDSAFLDWWLDVSMLRIDLSIAMLPRTLWDDSGQLPPGVAPGAHARP